MKQQLFRKKTFFLLLLVIPFFLTSCSDDDSDDTNGESSQIEVAGTWESSYGGFSVIGDDRWETGNLIEYDNEKNYAIIKSKPDNSTTATTYSKLVWTEAANGQFYYCTVTYGETSADEALNTTKVADDSDPASGGCDTVNNFPWTLLTKVPSPLEVTGAFESNYGGFEIIDSSQWSGSSIKKFDNSQNYVITESGSYPDYTYSKLVWTEAANGQFYYCTVTYGESSVDDAVNTTKIADDSDPASGGCDTVNNFPWTLLSKVTSELEVSGYYLDDYGYYSALDTSSWGEYRIQKYSNADNYVITQSGSYPDYTYSKLVWTEASNGQFYYCTVTYGESSVDDALNTTKVADDSDPASGGCDTVNNFPWTKMTLDQ